MTTTKQEKESLLDVLGKLAALASSGIVIASLAYDWGFFHAINLSFSDLPTSLTDHIRSALDWAPQVTGGIIAYLIIELLTRRIEGGRTESEILEASPAPKKLKRFRDSPMYLYAFIGAAAVVGYALLGDRFLDAMTLIASFCWILFIVVVMNVPRVRDQFSQGTRFIILCIPAIVIYFWITGRIDAIKLYESLPTTTITYTGNPPTVSRTSIIRYFDKGVLLKEANGEISFRQWSTIDRIEPASKLTIYSGMICAWTRKACINTLTTDTKTESVRVLGKSNPVPAVVAGSAPKGSQDSPPSK